MKMTKAKNRITGILIALILMVISALSLGGLQTKRANAQTETGEYTNKIYYFSDSDPTFKDALEMQGRDNVIYDVNYMASPQEFKYLLYTGYFWRFYGSFNVMVIIEVKSFALDQQTLNDLYFCLSEQKCGIMLISPYIDYGIFMNHYVQCAPDAYSEFLKKPFSVYFKQNDTTEIQDNTTFLLDERLIGIYEALPEYDFDSLIRFPELRRLYNYFAFGVNDEDIAGFEEYLYAELWEYYYENYLKDINYNGTNEYKDATMENLVTTWENKSEELGEPYGNMWGNYWEYPDEEYQAFSKETYRYYYLNQMNFFENFNSRHIHLIAHIDEENYVDLFDYDEYDNYHAKLYTFENYFALFETIQPSVSEPLFVYAMSQWEMKAAFYDFIKKTQDAIENGSHGSTGDSSDAGSSADEFIWNITELPLFVWCKDQLQLGEGGIKITDTAEKTEPTDEEIEELFNVLEEALTSIPY